MHRPLPPLNALRAFEVAARHLSLTKAAVELHVTPGALSHQIRGLEDVLGVELFLRLPRALALTEAGRKLYPGLHAAFAQIRQAVDTLDEKANERVLVVSTPPGFTAKWLAPRLYRFLFAHPEIDARISSTLTLATFDEDGIDVAIRNLPRDRPEDPGLVREHLVDLTYVPACSPRLLRQAGPVVTPADLRHVPLIHDEMLIGRAHMPAWADWLAAAGVTGVDLDRGLRLNSADHALDAAVEGAGMLLALLVLAHDDLRSGRLVAPFPLTIDSGRAFYFVCPRTHRKRKNVVAFHDWIRAEIDAMDLASVVGLVPAEAGGAAPGTAAEGEHP
jgi:LysR family glycine cleavage system transcriptional activator